MKASQKPPTDINPWSEWHKKKKQFGTYRLYLTGLIHTSRLAEVNGFVCTGLGLAREQRLHEEPSFYSPVQKGWVGSRNLTFHDKIDFSHQFT